MKKLISVAVAAALVTMAGVADAKDWKNIRIASEGAYPPWNSTDASGKLIGFDIDVANEVCKRQKVECEIIATAWDGIIPGLTSGKYDAIIAGMSITKKRMKVIAFSENYAQTPGSLAVVKDSPLASYKASLAKINLDAIGDAGHGHQGGGRNDGRDQFLHVKASSSCASRSEIYFGMLSKPNHFMASLTKVPSFFMERIPLLKSATSSLSSLRMPTPLPAPMTSPAKPGPISARFLPASFSMRGFQ